MSLTLSTQYTLWIIIGLLWTIQMAILLLIYQRVNREAKYRSIALFRRKVSKASATDAPPHKSARKERPKPAKKERPKPAKKESPFTFKKTNPDNDVSAIATTTAVANANAEHIAAANANESLEVNPKVNTLTQTIEHADNVTDITSSEEQKVKVEPTVEPSEPETTPEPEPDTTPEPEPDTTPEPEPETTPEPEPDTTPEPEPETTPKPEPDTTPEPEPEITSPMVDDEGFFGDLFGNPTPRRQPSNGRKRTLSEDAGQSIIDELIISEEELRNGPDAQPFPVLFADDPDATPPPQRAQTPKLSVIVVACNQDTQLRQNLPTRLEQDYPDYEVIVVDDNSNDDTTDILMYLQTRYPHLQIRTTPDSARRISHRKLSMMLGIKAAQGEWLVFTDADCRPLSRHWLSTMARQLPSVADPLCTEVDAVIGYTAYGPGEGIGAWIRRYDNMMRNVRLLGLALMGQAPMAYGSNLLYRRDIFFENKGFSKHLNLERGDDDLFVNENIQPRRIRAEIDGKAVILCTDNDAHRRTIEYLGRIVTGWRLHGLMPHLLRADTITRGLYAWGTLIVVLLAALSQAWVTLGIVAALWGIRYAVQWIILRRLQALFGEADYAPWTPLFELGHPIWAIALHFRYLFTPGSTWRRKII